MTTEENLVAIAHRVDPMARVLGWPTGHRGVRVLHAHTAWHGPIVVKVHQRPELHRQEVHAYREWTGVLGQHAPELLASFETSHAIVTSAVPARPLSEQKLTPEQQEHAHREAGRLLRVFHTAAPQHDNPPMTAWLAERGRQWIKATDDLLTPEQFHAANGHMDTLAELGPIPSVPCHLDYTPGNLLRADDGTITVIDFEHARLDLAARDLVRMANGHWPDHPEHEAAFLDGYGPLTDLDREVIRCCRPLDQLTALARANRREAPERRFPDPAQQRPAFRPKPPS